MGLSVCLFVTLLAVTCFAAAPTLKSAVAVGNQTDSHVAYLTPNRDGGCVGSVGGKIVWFWSDTIFSRNGTFAGFYGNSGAIGDANDMTNMTGPQRQAIPFTPAENTFNNVHGNNPRVVLWPKSGVVETSNGTGYLWVPTGIWGSTNDSTPDTGIALCSVVIGSDGFATVRRVSHNITFLSGVVPSYGSFAATSDAKYVYLYSQDTVSYRHSSTFIARVPLASPTNLTTYEYYNYQTQTWSTTLPTLAQSGQAIFNTTFGLDGSVLYSTYYKCWLMIFSYHGDAQVMMRTASKPEGPWSKDTLLYKPPTPGNPKVPYIYGTSATFLYDPSGQSVSIDFTWLPVKGGYINWDVQVFFN